MNRIKIVYIVPALMRSGPINVLCNLLRHLDRTNYEPIIVSLHEPKIRELNNTDFFLNMGITVFEFSYSLFEMQFRRKSIALKIQNQFMDTRVIFHAHGYYPTLILAEMREGKTMNTIHNICDQDFVYRRGGILGKYLANRFKKSLRKLDLCVVISNSMKEFYNIDRHLNINVVYNGVELGIQLPSGVKRMDILNQLSIPPNAKILLYPAPFVNLKNHQYLLETIKFYDRQDFVILFAGDGSTKSYCQKLAEADTRIRFLGYCMDLEPYWAIADFMISPSLSEGMPLAVLEALLRGIPPLLSNIPSHLEILNNIFGSDSLAFDLNDKYSLDHLFSKVFDMSFDRDKILQRSKKLYSSVSMCRGYERLYSSFFINKKF